MQNLIATMKADLDKLRIVVGKALVTEMKRDVPPDDGRDAKLAALYASCDVLRQMERHLEHLKRLSEYY